MLKAKNLTPQEQALIELYYKGTETSVITPASPCSFVYQSTAWSPYFAIDKKGAAMEMPPKEQIYLVLDDNKNVITATGL